MKKILSSVGVTLMLLVLTGCSTLKNYYTAKDVEPGQITAVVVDVVGDKADIGKIKNEFHFGQMVYVYVTLGWDETRRAQSLNIKWYNATDQVVAAKTYNPQYAKKPHHVWSWINSAQLGMGAVRVEVWADGQLISQVPFTVIEPYKREDKRPWYQRIFKKKVVDQQKVVVLEGAQSQ